jgi:glycosyltransferase involved in cell wall biosynthesis
LRRITAAAVLATVRERHALPAAFVLADALKNPAVLVHAWRLLPLEVRLGRQLVFFSRHASPPPIVHEAVQAGEAILLVRPSRDDLIALYSMAQVFVFPSWIEGFGLPLLEAMTCGAPVIASNRGAIPEVVGEAALLADADDVAAFADHLVAVLSDAQTAAHLRRAGYARAAQFSWSHTAQRILDCYAGPIAATTRPPITQERGA